MNNPAHSMIVDFSKALKESTRAEFTTPGTRVNWSSLAEWMSAWKKIEARAASSRKHEQRRAHVVALASNMHVVNRETNVETLASLKLLIERENILPPRGSRAGHPATEILQRVGTVLNERRGIVAAPAVKTGTRKTDWKTAA